jgi:hypothetical protein
VLHGNDGTKNFVGLAEFEGTPKYLYLHGNGVNKERFADGKN